ncbi:hypothetical protein IT072_14810 [Leifsonia sp. ZF2019]|uniref:hypothetical protein n=1 Tax=Leifsonia sp. ZF2019 TaxID=2781978 RepID=UPI001CBAFF12|nr:hypothetical protein [Leifsonia sp. ZF2019]UAJ78512.1 hypothetical protein IT072_14810 [Leifsonia sp. ZF2019]
MDMSDTGGVEYPDEAGYPDGEGTLDEGTGAFRAPGAPGAAGTVVEAADVDGGVDVEVEQSQGVDQLDEFDGADARDE